MEQTSTAVVAIEETPSTTVTATEQTTSSNAVVITLPKIVLSKIVISLVIRLVTFIFLLISMIVLATDSADALDIYGFPVQIKPTDFYAYRYMISAIAIGMAYTLVLAVLTSFHMTSGSTICSNGLSYFEFYSDKVITFLLATGAAAGFGLSVEWNRIENIGKSIQDFLNVANAAASLLLLGSVTSAISSILSSLNLPKRSSQS